MGQRGPIPDLESRRSRKVLEKQERDRKRQRVQLILDGKTVPITDEQGGIVGSLPACPDGLPVRVTVIWHRLVNELHEAGVPLQQVDTHGILMAARCLDSIATAEEIANDPSLSGRDRLDAMKLKHAYEKDLLSWLPLIGATLASRVRIGVKDQTPQEEGPLAKLLAAKHGAKDDSQ